jgi:hypothetical protein
MIWQVRIAYCALPIAHRVVRAKPIAQLAAAIKKTGRTIKFGKRSIIVNWRGKWVEWGVLIMFNYIFYSYYFPCHKADKKIFTPPPRPAPPSSPLSPIKHVSIPVGSAIMKVTWKYNCFFHTVSKVFLFIR